MLMGSSGHAPGLLKLFCKNHVCMSPYMNLYTATSSKLYVIFLLIIQYNKRFGFSGQSCQLYNTILVPWQYWLGLTKPKSVFSSALNASNRLY